MTETMRVDSLEYGPTYWRQITKAEYDALQPTEADLRAALDELPDTLPVRPQCCCSWGAAVGARGMKGTGEYPEFDCADLSGSLAGIGAYRLQVPQASTGGDDMTCDARLEVVLSKTTTVRTMRCDMEPHGPSLWHRSPEGSRWKSRDRNTACQVRIGDENDFLAYTCLRPLPCDVPGHTDFQAHGLENERTNDMGGNAHSTEVKVETEDATTTVSAPDEASTEAQAPAEASTESGSESSDSE